ncbi:filamentous hemagglutinin N-terminal domain-containing protein [Bradyrhizobium sp. Arg237L]|uniref:two-partner secretion domain-containing protein n=1 Tax=Bradyrhizobium sp. Arg237L TaxID=3003352 RepID=UPI00249EC99B|nr:filamentous hemagglutinin N-terminal domain-containing protein [Bradyrhizobium sp. Arg237L]MDI4236712.1 filamentous hemagglutinin N-terminal domain-containing protein [Bradyrhizobium sp. Arg237L]
MLNYGSDFRAPQSRRKSRRVALLAGASVIALTFAPSGASARPLGGATPTPSAAAIAAAQSTQQEAARAASQSSDALKRATLAIQAQQASQQAARDAARAAANASSVPNGLGVDGLQRAAGAVPGTDLWQGANLPTQFTDGDRVKVNIGQTQQKAILTWDTFNVGARTDLTFDQRGNRDWVALNRVLGPDGRPSQILGSIKADGSVYVINQNGIIFGGGSQINVGALIASTAKIDPQKFLDNGIYSAQSGSTWTPSFTDAAEFLGRREGAGKVEVKAGAQITTHAPAEVTQGGGYVLLMGGEVVNAGAITTPLGQTQLAAGDAFVLRRGYSTEENQFSTTRGNEIAPVIGNAPGRVTNTGMIFSPQGDITLVGRTIEQNGILVASTSVNTRGTIHLLNSATDTLGSITLGVGSITTIIPELESRETALNSQRDGLIAASDEANRLRAQADFGVFNNLSKLADRLDQSRIEIVTGGNVVFKGGATSEAGSLTVAQGGQVAVSAGGRIFNESGSIIDVSGVRDVPLAMSANNILVNIQGYELRDSPQNRDNNYLKNANVWVDIRDLVYVPAGTGGYDSDRYYTPGGLLEVGGYLANARHGIGEWSALGGTITLSANEVIAQAGSVFDISGGSVRYEGGYIRTTNFLGSDGRLYNINDARADMTFYGLGQGFIRESKRWNVTEVWTSPLGRGRESVRWEDGYTVGRDAGRLILSTPTAIFEGDILADVVQGERQFTARPDGIADGYKAAQNVVAQAGQLLVGTYGSLGRSGVHDTQIVIGDVADSTGNLEVTSMLPADRKRTLYLDAERLKEQSLGRLDLATAGTIAVESDLTLADGGSLDLTAPTIDIRATITARSGSVTLTNALNMVVATTGDTSILPLLPASGLASITLGSGSSIDTRGLWTNALLDPGKLSGLAYIDGGNVTLKAGNVTLEPGSRIDASSGGGILANGKTKGGAGGDVTLIANTAAPGVSNKGITGGGLVLDGTVRSTGVTKGGTLTLDSGTVIVIGDQSYDLGTSMVAGEVLPVDVILTKDVVWPAGAPLPAPATLTVTKTVPAGVLTDDLSLTATTTNTLLVTADLVVAPGGLGSLSSMSYQTSSGGSATILNGLGGTIPAGSKLRVAVTFKAGLVTVGAAGLSITGPTVFNAGDVAPSDVTFLAGTRLAQNSVLPVAISFQPFKYLHLAPDLFSSGFSGYNVQGGAGLVVADNTALRPAMPVYRFGAAAYSTPTGADPASALELWTPPLFIENPATATLTQRSGVDLTLASAYTDIVTSAGWMYVGKGASIEVDPGHSVTLSSGGQITVEGSIVAPGGAISLIETYLGTGLVRNSGPVYTSFLIGDGAVLDVSARAYTAVDSRGRRYGVVPDGGTITFGRLASSATDDAGIAAAADAFIIIQRGALLDASGASATLDLLTGTAHSPAFVASNGGAISLSSYDGILAEGTLRAFSGGTGAAGGSLSLMMETPFYGYGGGSFGATVAPSVQVGRTLTIGQSSVPGAMPAGADPRTVKLTVGQGGVSADAIMAGGFDSISLGARAGVIFDGDVNLSAGRAITLAGGALYDTAANGAVTLNAPYVLLDGLTAPTLSGNTAMPSKLPASITGTTGAGFAVAADLIDVRNAMATHFADTRLSSAGDLRLLAGTLTSIATNALTSFNAADGNLTLTAAQIYPVSGANTFVRAGGVTTDGINYTYRPGATLTISSADGVVPDLPYSVFGAISLLASNVYQGGVVRAPLGSITIGITPMLPTDPDTYTELLPGSITSVSAAGLVVPYGGTVDGVDWKVNGSAPITANLLTGQLRIGGAFYTQGVTLNGTRVVGDAGASLDLSGGGTLTGAGFISGRGGSVDVLTTALVTANPANTYSKASDKVYAIVPGIVTAPVAGGYASKWTGSVPGIGQQIAIPEGVPGLPAGTYTLLPANYALLPGAFRVELGSKGSGINLPSGATGLGNGSYLVAGYEGVANTMIRDSLATQVIVTPGATARSYSQYNETGYAGFQLAQAATFGTLRPLLPADGKFLTIQLGALLSGSSSDRALVFDGDADFTPAAGGYGGSLILFTASNRKLATVTDPSTPNMLEIVADGSTTLRSTTVTTVSASSIEAIAAPNLYLGGAPTYFAVNNTEPAIGFRGGGYASGSVRIANPLTVESSVTLRGARVFLAGNTVTLEDGAVIDTRGYGVQAPDSSSGFGFQNVIAASSSEWKTSLLVVSNGDLVLDGSKSEYAGNISIGNGVSLLSDGTIGFIAQTNPTFAGTPNLAAKTLALAASSINIGTDASMAAAPLPAGLNLNPGWLSDLLTNVANLNLSASNSVNFYGAIDLDFGAERTLALTTPAIYGAGSGDAILKVGTLVWNGAANGSASATPGAIASSSGRHGSGSGTFTVNATDIVFGYAKGSLPDASLSLDRLMLGFSSVAFNASNSISVNNKGTLSVYQSGADPATISGGYKAASYSGSGGALNLNTPLLTGEAGSILKIYAGGNVSVTGTPSSAKPSALGAEIGIVSRGAVNIDTAIYLPSGRFSVTASGDITLGAASRIDLSGQAMPMFDVTKYSWGGDVLLESTYGNIVQAAGSIIDLSAINNDAGMLTLTATGTSNGQVTLAGALKASSGGGFNGGSFDIRAQKIGGDPTNLSVDFATLNAVLDASGFTQARSFDFKQGSLVIGSGQTVKAHHVTISIDGGSLTVNGTVDASGTRVGSIILASRDDLTINGVLDARGTTLDTDSKGVAIAANNSATIDLTTKSGTLVLGSGAVLDLSTPGGTAYGELTLNASRSGETSGDVKVSAAGPLAIRGAKSIYLNAFWTYDLPAGSTVTQATLDAYDVVSKAFMGNAYSGNALNGTLQAKLAGLLTDYASAFHLRPGVEITSTGDLNVSMPTAADGSGGIDLGGYRYGPNAMGDGTGEPMALTIRAGGDLKVNGSIADGFKSIPGTPSVIGGTFNIASNSNYVDGDLFGLGVGIDYYAWVGSSTTLYFAEEWTVPDDLLYIVAGGFDTHLGNYAPGQTIPAGTAFTPDYVVFESSVALPLLATSFVQGTPNSPATSALAPRQAPGTQSASIRLVSGADLAAASTRTLTAQSVLAGKGNLTLSDQHTGTVNGAPVVAASVLRTGSGDLDLLAGGNFDASSIYNVSTNGESDNDSADLTIKAQGDLSGQILSPKNVTATQRTSSFITNWLNGNQGTTAYYDGFTGFGALGGGRVAIDVGGDAGQVTVMTSDSSTYYSTGLAVAATSGDVTVNIGGRLNPKGNAVLGSSLVLAPPDINPDLNGVFTALRGDLSIKAGAIGVLPLVYGLNEINDPRGVNYASAALAIPKGAITVVAGDGATSLQARGDLTLGTIGASLTAAYWTDTTSVSLFSAGGNLTPITATSLISVSANSYRAMQAGAETYNLQLPPIFKAVAASGSIYYGGIFSNSAARELPVAFRLESSPYGALELLAMDSIYGASTSGRSGLPPARWEMQSNTSLTLHDGDTDPIRVYAVNGDLVNIVLGSSYSTVDSGVTATTYNAAKAARVIAGGDIVNFGRAGAVTDRYLSGTAGQFPSVILNTNDNDVSVIKAGGNIYYLNVNVAGPGSLEVTAGGNVYQGDKGSIVSIGPIATGDTRPGASIAITAGAGQDGPNYEGLLPYLDPANLAVYGTPLVDQPGKVAKTYEKELAAWLQQRYGFAAASDEDARAYFAGLASEQRAIFLRTIYFNELRESGREYTGKIESTRLGSYIRGRQAIAALFPDVEAIGNPISYAGDVTMFSTRTGTTTSDGSLRTRHGGDIQFLVPGGQIVVGVEGVVPGPMPV